MKVIKCINNNVISCCGEDGREMVAMGRGLGFSVRPGDEIDDSRVEKLFRMESTEQTQKLTDLFASLPSREVELCSRIVDRAMENLGKLSPSVYLTLTDHVCFAIERRRQGIVFQNSLLAEVKFFYPREYAMGKYALELIDNELGIQFSDDVRMAYRDFQPRWGYMVGVSASGNPFSDIYSNLLEFYGRVYLPGFFRNSFHLSNQFRKSMYFQKMLDDLNKLCVFLPMGDNIYGVIGTHDNAGLFNSDGSIRKVPYEQFSDEDKKRKPILIVKYLADDHKQAKEKHKNYWSWVENRNPARHELEEKYGYDCKHALHLVRLMRMAEEILAEGKVLVKRPDAQELLAIRNGAWSLEKLLAWAEEKDDYIRNTLYKNTHLPKTTDLNFAADVLMTAQKMSWDKMNDG